MTARHIRNVRAFVGYVLCSFNEQTPQQARHEKVFFKSKEIFGAYHIVDTPEDRAIGVMFYTKNSQKLERRLERAGLMILKNQQIKVLGPEQRLYAAKPTLMTVRVPEEQDIQVSESDRMPAT